MSYHAIPTLPGRIKGKSDVGANSSKFGSNLANFVSSNNHYLLHHCEYITINNLLLTERLDLTVTYGPSVLSDFLEKYRNALHKFLLFIFFKKAKLWTDIFLHTFLTDLTGMSRMTDVIQVRNSKNFFCNYRNHN